MKIKTPRGYLREGRATDDEIRWMFDVMKTWPTGGWVRERCSNALSKSEFVEAMLEQDPIPAFNGLVLIYCASDDTRVGLFCVDHVHAGATTGADFRYFAIDPALQGAGNGSAMWDAATFFANQVLKTDHASAQVLDVAPQILTMATRTNALVGEKQEDGKTGIAFARDAVAATLKADQFEVEKR